MLAIYIPDIEAISSIVKPLSIKKPNIAVPNAVENTIKADVIALILPMYFTPYSSAQVAEPKTFANPLVIPINPKNMKEEIGLWKNIKTMTEKKIGIFIKINNFLLENLSIKKPARDKVTTDKIE